MYIYIYSYRENFKKRPSSFPLVWNRDKEICFSFLYNVIFLASKKGKPVNSCLSGRGKVIKLY